MGKVRLFFVVSFFSATQSYAIQKSVECQSVNFFQTYWPALIQIEPRLQAFVEKMASLSGSDPSGGLQTTNCNVEWEADDHQIPIGPERGMLADRVWSTDGGKTLFRAGFKIRYWVNPPDASSATETVGGITGVAFCGDVDACKYFSIPFAQPALLQQPSAGLLPLPLHKR